MKKKYVKFKSMKITFYDHATWESKLEVNSLLHGHKETVELKDLRKRGEEIVRKHYPEQTMFTIKFGQGSDAPIYFYQIR